MGLRLVGAESRCRPLRSGKLDKEGGTIGMEHLGFEHHLRWLIGELTREAQGSFVEPSLERRVLWPLEAYSPLEEVFVLEANRDGEVRLALLRN